MRPESRNGPLRKSHACSTEVRRLTMRISMGRRVRTRRDLHPHLMLKAEPMQFPGVGAEHLLTWGSLLR